MSILSLICDDMLDLCLKSSFVVLFEKDEVQESRQRYLE
jgi:hypothetical protein